MIIKTTKYIRDGLCIILKKVYLYSIIRWIYYEFRYVNKFWPHKLSASWGRGLGITKVKRNPELIVSLTSIPERLATIHLCLDSLLRQSLKPDRLILWLNESCEENRPKVLKNQIPSSLTRLERRGLEIRWCKDIGPYTKIIPTLRAFPSALIVTADDDILYPRHWLKDLYESYQREPQYIHCHRAHLMKYADSGDLMPYNQWDFESPNNQGPSLDLFPTGVGGVLYSPGQLSDEVLNQEVFLRLSPKADDVWLKAMSLLNGVLCKKVASGTCPLISVRILNNYELFKSNFIEGGNDPQIRAVWDNYKIGCM